MGWNGLVMGWGRGMDRVSTMHDFDPAPSPVKKELTVISFPSF